MTKSLKQRYSMLYRDIMLIATDMKFEYVKAYGITKKPVFLTGYSEIYGVFTMYSILYKPASLQEDN